MDILKPWYLWRPRQIYSRARAWASPPTAGYQELRTAWGDRMIADPSKTIGRSILTTGVYDLAVSEVLIRLIGPGDTVIDAGANIGYMSLLSSLACGVRGRVLAYEPVREVFGILERNVEIHQRTRQLTNISLRNCALGDIEGTAWLEIPAGFDANDGIARVSHAVFDSTRSTQTTLRTIDAELGDSTANLLKLDVEGFESSVLQGARASLDSRRITHVIFEDHQIDNSEVARQLADRSYSLYSLGWTLSGLSLGPLSRGLARAYEAPSFLATLEPTIAEARCAPRGWRVLRPIRASELVRARRRTR